eukprot:10829555-Lingulodinium_polyedra.AAC.1
MTAKTNTSAGFPGKWPRNAPNAGRQLSKMLNAWSRGSNLGSAMRLNLGFLAGAGRLSQLA